MIYVSDDLWHWATGYAKEVNRNVSELLRGALEEARAEAPLFQRPSLRVEMDPGPPTHSFTEFRPAPKPRRK